MKAPFAAGDVVRPNAEAISVTNYRESSRLTIRHNRGGGDHWCNACVMAKVAEYHARGSTWMRPSDAQRNLTFAAPEPGSLYAAGKEQSCPLCINHVELVEDE